MSKRKKYQHIHTCLTEDEFNQFVLKHLTNGTRGPSTKVSYYRLFNYILKLMHTGFQWEEIPIEKDTPGKPEIHHIRIFHIFQRWQKDGCFEKVFVNSVHQLFKGCAGRRSGIKVIDRLGANYQGASILSESSSSSFNKLARRLAAQHVPGFIEHYIAGGFTIAQIKLVGDLHDHHLHDDFLQVFALLEFFKFYYYHRSRQIHVGGTIKETTINPLSGIRKQLLPRI